MYDIDIGRHMGGSIDDKYGAEQLFINLLGKSVFRTTNPKEAHLFFMPFRCTAYRKYVEDRVEGGKLAMTTVAEYVNHVIQEYPYWNASAGSNHFYICAHDMGTSVAQLASPDLLKNAIALVNTADYSEPTYSPHKDIALPPNVDVVAAIHVATSRVIELETARLAEEQEKRLQATGERFPHPDMTDEPLLQKRIGILSKTGQGGGAFPATARNRLAFFAGNLKNGPLRGLVKAAVENDKDFDIVSGQLDSKTYLTKLATSKFCLFLRGFRAWSPRLMDAVFTGCVPVIISDHYDLPFQNIFDWKRFSVIVPQSKISSLKSILQAISPQQLRQMQQQLQQVYHHFVWNDNPGYMDAFHLTLFELWKRRSVISYD